MGLSLESDVRAKKIYINISHGVKLALCYKPGSFDATGPPFLFHLSPYLWLNALQLY
jgi:hypothetical protein